MTSAEHGSMYDLQATNLSTDPQLLDLVQLMLYVQRSNSIRCGHVHEPGPAMLLCHLDHDQ